MVGRYMVAVASSGPFVIKVWGCFGVAMGAIKKEVPRVVHEGDTEDCKLSVANQPTGGWFYR